MRCKQLSRHQLQRGTTLIEVLVALVLVSIGLFGYIALQTKIIQIDLDNYQRSYALICAEDMVNRLMINNTVADRACYSTEEFSTLPGEWGANDTSELGCDNRSDADLLAWNKMLRGENEIRSDGDEASGVGGIIKGVGCIERDLTDNKLWYVSVAWQGFAEMALPDTASTCGNDNNRYETGTRRVVTLPVRMPTST